MNSRLIFYVVVVKQRLFSFDMIYLIIFKHLYVDETKLEKSWKLYEIDYRVQMIRIITFKIKYLN